MIKWNEWGVGGHKTVDMIGNLAHIKKYKHETHVVDAYLPNN